MLEKDRVRLAYNAMMDGQLREMADAVMLISDDKSLPARGIRALLLAHLGETTEALNVQLPTGGALTTEDLNGGYWLHYGRYICLLRHKDYVGALLEIGEARAYARMLGDDRRVQLLAFESQEVAVQMGRAAPEVIEQQLCEEMSDKRRSWHTADHYAPALLQHGRYATACAVAPVTSAVHYLARVLAGQGLGGMGEADGEEYPVARAWGNLWSGRVVDWHRGIFNGVMQTYADLAYAGWLAQDAATAGQVRDVLGDEVPLRADQAVLWAAVQLQALARGATLADPLDLTHVLMGALAQLSETDAVLNVVSHVCPEALVIATFGPQPHPHLRAASLRFTVDARRHTAEGVTAGYTRQPLRTLPGRFPNAGIVFSGLEALVEAAEDGQQVGPARVWQLGIEAAWRYATPEAVAVLEDKIVHCFAGEDDARLKA